MCSGRTILQLLFTWTGSSEDPSPFREGTVNDRSSWEAYEVQLHYSLDMNSEM